MAISVKHAKTSAVADSGDSSLVQPSDWNNEHAIAGVQETLVSGVNIQTLNGVSLLGPGDATAQLHAIALCF